MRFSFAQRVPKKPLRVGKPRKAALSLQGKGSRGQETVARPKTWATEHTVNPGVGGSHAEQTPSEQGWPMGSRDWLERAGRNFGGRVGSGNALYFVGILATW